MKLRIKVTAEHIRRGVRQNGASCMIAQAIRPVFPSATVGQSEMWLEYNPLQPLCLCRTSIKHTDDIASKINVFDNGGYIEPFEFDIPIDESHIGCVMNANAKNLELIPDDEEAE